MTRTKILTVLAICLTGPLIATLISRTHIGRQGPEIVATADARETPRERDRTRACSDDSLKGSYGLSLTGTVDGIGPGGALGTLTFDGDGHMNGSGTAKIIGITRQGTVFGPYSVNSDCTGEGSLTSSGGLSVVGSFVIVRGGEEVLFIGGRPVGSVPQAFLSGSAKKL